METKKEKIRKPPIWLTIQLFIFMMIVIVDICGLVDNFKSLWLDNLDYLSSVYVAFSGGLDILVYAYALLSIYTILQHKPYSVFMLRLSVFYVFTQIAFRFLSGNNVIPMQIGINALVFLSGIIFFVYLFKSHGMKAFIPRTERKVGAYGALGLMLYLAVVPLYAYPSYYQITKNRKSLPIPVKNLQLSYNTYRDGLTEFRAIKNWQLDTIAGDAKQGYLFAFNSHGSRDILVHSFNAECRSRLEFYQLLSNVCNHILGKPYSLGEVKYGEVNEIGNICYYECYNIGTPSVGYKYWWYVALCDKTSYKILELSYLCNDLQTSQREIKDFIKSVTFKLK